MSHELKPCPFCGGEPRSSVKCNFIKCSNNKCRMGLEVSMWFTPLEWNTRVATEETARADVAEATLAGTQTALNVITSEHEAQEERVVNTIVEISILKVKLTKETARADAADRLITTSGGLSCPNDECNNNGFTQEQDGFGQWYQVQCEWCYTVSDSVFNKRKSEDKP